MIVSIREIEILNQLAKGTLTTTDGNLTINPIGGTTSVVGSLTVGSNTTISGSLTISNDLTVSGNLAVDTDVLYVDSVNDRVGIKTTSPAAKLDLALADVSDAIRIHKSSNADRGWLVFDQGGGIYTWRLGQLAYNDGMALYNSGESVGDASSPGSVITKWDVNGNVGIRTEDQFGSGKGVLALANASTNPTSNPTDAIILFAKDYDDGDGTASSELFVRDEDGNETNLSPHAFELYQPDLTDPFPWTYHSVNYLIGKKINVDMSGAIRELEKLTGKKFIYVEDVEKIPLSKHIKDKKEALIKKWQEENAEEVEITLEEAVEEVEVEVEDREQVVGKEKRYRFENGKVVEEEVPVYGRKKEKQKRLKEGVRLDEKTGKFYKKVMPSRKEVLKALKQNPKFRVRRWLKERL